jgi:hypothetical protein
LVSAAPGGAADLVTRLGRPVTPSSSRGSSPLRCSGAGSSFCVIDRTLGTRHALSAMMSAAKVALFVVPVGD